MKINRKYIGLPRTTGFRKAYMRIRLLLIVLSTQDAHDGGVTPEKASEKTLRKTAMRYVTAVLVVAAAFAVRFILSLAVGPGLPPFIFFYPAVMTVAVLAGVFPGLLATGAAALATALLVLPAEGHSVFQKADALSLAVFICMGAFMSIVAALLRDARQRSAEYQKELSVRESEKRFSAFFHATPIGMNIRSFENGRCIDVNQSFLDLSGFSREEVLGSTSGLMETWVDPAAREVFGTQLQKQERVRDREVQYCKKSGEVWTARVSAEVIEAGGEKVILTVLQDVTERRRAEKALRDSEERFRGTLDNMMEGCQIIGHDWRYLYINDTAARHGLKPREELLGRTMAEVYPGIETTPLFDMMKECMDERLPGHMENEFKYPDGTSAWFDLGFQPVPEGIFILSYDITERKRADRALRDSRTLLQSVIDLVPHFIFAKDRDSRHLFVNRACAEANGMTPEQMIGLSDADFPRDQAEAKKFMDDDRDVIDSGRSKTDIEERLTDSRGRVRILHTIKIPFTPPGTSIAALLGVAVDITDLKNAEEQIRTLNRELEGRVQARTSELRTANGELEERTRQLVQSEEASRRYSEEVSDLYLNAPCGYHSLDEDGNFLRVNDTELRMLGYTREELVGRVNVRDLFTPEAGGSLRRTFRTSRRTG